MLSRQSQALLGSKLGQTVPDYVSISQHTLGGLLLCLPCLLLRLRLMLVEVF